jgi:hypothetical protein
VLSSQRVAMADALFNAGKTKDAKEQATNPLIEDGQKLIPSVTRVFSRSRDLYIYLQAYEREATTMHPLAAVVTLLKGEEVVFESPAYTVNEGMDPKSKAVPFKLSLPLGPVQPGEYCFRLLFWIPRCRKLRFGRRQ